MPDEKQPSIEVLADRMNNVTATLGEIKTLLVEQGRTIQEIPVLKFQLQQHDEQLARAFKSLKDLHEANDENNSTIEHSKGMLKAVSYVLGVACTIAISLAGWAYNQLDGLKSTDRDLTLRIASMEVRSVEAEKINQKGWVRK
jgi:hypothetical protein